MTGKLYLIPAFLGESEADNVFPPHNKAVMAGIKHFIVEDERSGRRFLKKIDPATDISTLTFYLLDGHTRDQEVMTYLDAAKEGNDVGLLSEAGMPCIADPGAMVVRMAHETGITVVPLVGPSSIFMALAASGFNGQSFAFHGYLPIDKSQRFKKIKELEQTLMHRDQTQMFIETPYRNVAMFEALVQSCRPDTMLCIACDVSLDTESITTCSIGTWKGRKPDIHKRPAIFLLGQ